MMRSISALSALLLSLVASSALAASDRDTRKITALIARIDGAPTRSQLVAASPKAEAILRQLAADRASAPMHRNRAVAALAHFPSPETRRTLRALLRDPQATELIRGRALLAMSGAFKDASIPEIGAYLSDRSTVLRDSAVQALGRIGTPKSKDRLRKALRRSRDPALSSRIRAALRPPR